MRVVLEDGYALHVRVRGPEARETGPPVMLLHGFTGAVDAWGSAVLTGLAAERRVVAVDLPGHGASDLPSRRGGLSLPGVVHDLARVLDRLDVDRAVWVGYSMGGRIALGAGVLRPGRVDRLILESASPGLASEDGRLERRAADEACAAALEARGLEAWIDRWMALPLFASQRELPPEVRARERTRRLENTMEGLARTLRELGTGSQPSFWDELHLIEVPVLLLTGELDPAFCRTADDMARRLPAARRATVAGAGHAVHLEAPDAWLEAVCRFLRETRPSDR